jgi:hypothetical protein
LEKLREKKRERTHKLARIIAESKESKGRHPFVDLMYHLNRRGKLKWLDFNAGLDKLLLAEGGKGWTTRTTMAGRTNLGITQRALDQLFKLDWPHGECQRM